VIRTLKKFARGGGNLEGSALMVKRVDQAEVVGEEQIERLQKDLELALRRKPAHEAKLAGALRALCPLSARLRAGLGDTLEVLVKRASFDRPLYGALVRALADASDRRGTQLLKRALATEDAGGLATLSAASFVGDSALADGLAKVATGRHPHLVFAAEVARVARGESNGQHLASVAPKIKEAHRITLCVELLVPLLWRPPLPKAVAPALEVLRDAERHLGRWLVLGELAARAGDPKPLAEAERRASDGPGSARSAWGLVAWALRGQGPPPTIRPTVELVARLSDRPSADRDTTFLYRLAAAGSAASRPMLETVAKGLKLPDETALRAALYLVRDHGRADLREALAEVARNPRREAHRGLAAAALLDAGEDQMALTLSDELIQSRQLPTMAWAALIRARQALKGNEVVSEPNFRWIQLGWVE
jgi:hypothetical protein